MSKDQSAPQLLTVRDVQLRLKCSRGYAYELVATLPCAVRLGRAVRVPEDCLARFIAKGGRSA